MKPLTLRARQFAAEAHFEQRYDGGPFIRNHVDHVVATLVRFGHTKTTLIAAAYLHDTVEDTDVTVFDIANEFGILVSGMVWALTREDGPENRKSRLEKYFHKLQSHRPAIAVKLADRIANVEASILGTSDTTNGGGSYYKMYQKEYEPFRRILYRKGEYDLMWEHLDVLMEYNDER